MNIELTQEEFDFFQKMMEKFKPKEYFTEAVKTKPIEDLIGKSFADQEGLFSGRLNNVYYFIESNKTVNALQWDYDTNRPKGFQLPTKEELMFLYVNKKTFNANCTEDERWLDESYLSSTELNIVHLYYVLFEDGKVNITDRNNTYYARGVRYVEDILI